MRIMFLIPRMGSGGAERVISILANEFGNRNNTVHIAQLVMSDSFYDLNSDIELSGMNIKIRRNNKFVAIWDQGRFFLKGLGHIRNQIKTFKPDVIISFMRQTCIMMWVLKMIGVKTKLICSERNDPTVQNVAIRFLMKHVFAASDILVCQGKGVADYFSNVKNRVIIPNPVADRSELYVPFEKRRKVVTAIGRLDKQKNFELLIRSFESVHKMNPEYRLEIYGEGPMRESLQKLINDLSSNSYISLMGAHKDVLERIADTELFVMSSNYEGFPNALAEAMSIGLPVISTDFFTGTARELIGQKNGVLVPVGDVEEMAKAIDRLLNDDELRRNAGVLNKSISSKFGIKNIVNQWIEIL